MPQSRLLLAHPHDLAVEQLQRPLHEGMPPEVVQIGLRRFGEPMPSAAEPRMLRRFGSAYGELRRTTHHRRNGWTVESIFDLEPAPKRLERCGRHKQPVLAIRQRLSR